MRLQNDVTDIRSIHRFKTLEHAFNERHKGLYNYSEAVYSGYHKKIIIKCNTCNSVFNQTPVMHLDGRGCRICAARSTSVKLSATSRESFIEKANAVHNYKYCYNGVVYVNNRSKVEILCPVHEAFWQSPGGHLSGRGCNSCANIERQKKYYKEPTILYYVKFKTLDSYVYKIGITLKRIGVNKRYYREKLSTIKIWEYEFSDGKIAYSIEQMLLKIYRVHLYMGPPVLTGGNSELFNIDVLGLDKIKEIVWSQ